MLNNDILFTTIGIDSIGFYAPRTYVDLEELALKRCVDPEKYSKGLLLKEMRFPESDEDIISIGLKAGYSALLRGNINPKLIDGVFVGTETMTYAVKSVSNILGELLNVSSNSMTQDIYNACAAGTLAIINAMSLVEKGIIHKALVINADISSYKIGSPSEPTQGSGSVAFVISKNPRIATLSKKFGKVSGNVNDFFRNANEPYAEVFGRYSVESYLNFQLEAYDDLVNNIGNFYADYYVFHAPFSKLPIKCMQQIIQKRWKKSVQNIPYFTKNGFKDAVLRKVDSLLQSLILVPEFFYLKLKERGTPHNISFEGVAKVSNTLASNIKDRILPQLRVPMHFGNMYTASVWAQILYILENFAQANDTIYFGSYGSGATCISGLLKVQRGFKTIMGKGPKVNDFIEHKERKTVQEYEDIKNHQIKPQIILGHIKEFSKNQNRGFTLRFCDKGCIIPDIKGLNYCPKGHSGYHERFFPLYATLESKAETTEVKDLSFLTNDLVRIAPNARMGIVLECEIRRIGFGNLDKFEPVGLLNWTPIYVPAFVVY